MMKKSMMMIPLSLYLPLLAMILHAPQATAAQESDPCYNYTVLNDTWRATTNLDRSSQICDSASFDVKYNVSYGGREWQGWYLFVHQEVSVRIPNTCVPWSRCGTIVALWLNGTHPRPEDGIVTRQVCGHWSSGCCHFKPPSIQVKACPGNYTVYKLVDPFLCHSAYCTDLSDTGALPTRSPDPSRSCCWSADEGLCC
ncbi:pancreatic secretory granule membrane major glycoprotein GP2-like isoform X2 [Sardina pilchardus]|uniref:pancreatic secretory granule membrane major glycoprotein GP2-like isoform X2 n=1 Tax=Sardina pilchardus TaxID=27697 RepID=UPI002E0FF272